jgi:hypothetical protein
VRAHDGLEDDASAQGVPGVGATLGEEDLADAARGDLAAGVADDADAEDGDVELVVVDLGDAADGALGNAGARRGCGRRG